MHHSICCILRWNLLHFPPFLASSDRSKWLNLWDRPFSYLLKFHEFPQYSTSLVPRACALCLDTNAKPFFWSQWLAQEWLEPKVEEAWYALNSRMLYHREMVRNWIQEIGLSEDGWGEGLEVRKSGEGGKWERKKSGRGKGERERIKEDIKAIISTETSQTHSIFEQLR